MDTALPVPQKRASVFAKRASLESWEARTGCRRPSDHLFSEASPKPRTAIGRQVDSSGDPFNVGEFKAKSDKEPILRQLSRQFSRKLSRQFTASRSLDSMTENTSEEADLLNPRMCTGYLIDYLQRQPELDVGEMAFDPNDNVGETAGHVLLSYFMGQDWSAYKDAAEIIDREMLVYALMEDITIFWKSKSDPQWKVTRNAFKKYASEIVKLHQEARCLNAEVDHWLFRHRLRHLRPADEEPMEEKHDRLQSFWAQFHEGSRKQELPSLKPPYKDDFRKRGYRDNFQELPQESDTSSGRQRLRGIKPVRCLRQTNGGRKRGESLMHDMTWKNRSMRSKCSAGMWDWTQGQGASKLRTSPPPTAKGRMSQHWTTGLFSLDDEEIHEFVDALEAKEEEASSFGDDSEFDDDDDSSVGAFRPVTPQPQPPGLSRLSTLVRTAMSMPNLHTMIPTTPSRLASPSRPCTPAKLPEMALLPGRPDTSLAPPVHHAFQLPWENQSPTPLLKCRDSPTKRYLRACDRDRSIPRPLPLITGHSMRLNAAGQALFDKDLLAVAVTLEDVGIEEVDLEGNSSLSEKALLKFTKALCQQPASTSLKWLSFKRCLNAGKAVMGTVIKMIKAPDGVVNLRHLDLTDVAFGMQHHLPFARAIRDHKALKTLHLCNTGLGSGIDPKQCIGDILSSLSVEVMDLSWNCFSASVFSHIGEKQVEMQRVRKLSLSNCSAAPKPGHASPIVHFLEHLSRDSKLRELDISLNQMDFRAALVLEDALQHVKRLTDLNISYNTLGILGMRSLLRLLSLDSSGLMHFSCEECSTGQTRLDSSGFQSFSFTSPGGRYSLELERPYHRALLRMLYKTCERFNLPPPEAFTGIVYTAPPFVHAQKDHYNVWCVPEIGKLHVTFSIDKAIMQAMEGMSDDNFSEYLKRYDRLMRCKPGFRKVIPLFSQWKSIDGHGLEQSVMLDSISQDFKLTWTHMEQFCHSKAVALEVVARMLDCIEGTDKRWMTMGLLRNIPDFVRMLKRVQPLLTFNFDNPNGKYKLDLGNHAEHAVAEKLLLLDRWETNVAQRLKLIDTSQRGNYSVLRNEKYQHRSLSWLRALSDWVMPDHDVLEFDYSSSKRPPLNVPAIDSVTFQNFMLTLSQSHCSPVEQLLALRTCSHHFYVTAVQLRAMFGTYREEDIHAEILVTFFTRVIDMYNEKVFRVRIENLSLLDELRARLGYIQMFPYVQPEQATLTLDFSQQDQRITANILMNLSKAEHPYNLRNPRYIRMDGTVDSLALGIPRSWEVYEKMPQGGIFTVSYICAPENRNFQARGKMFESYGHWPMDVGEDKVMWWASLAEAPEDVLEYLEFLIGKGFPDMHQAFLEIDGEDGNGVISLREFETSYQEMGCKKFQGKDESKRIEAVFRYLDPSGEGQVSEDEFMILQLLFKEIQLAIVEFVEFCERTFGEDLQLTWRYLDEDESGDIDAEEWDSACRKIGYCGPVGPIFNYLDKDDEGTVSLDEFQVLEKFKSIGGENVGTFKAKKR